ncbi:translation initiation factor 5A precursor (eIF-5A) [Candidatus Methanoperedens nitroreducens]|uniref:Translation initiation factor 5A n=1 Tax=Candidatus Methanoperedens nitratireducens TaxID=1392998 RepID=A0A062V7S1_9EURY|nr:translation initiation factor IF-5A [Candidatus Methanoperedens nitroreducens]KCZ72618.1 translation initiation factor 5A precursor (eIF-5A) [Candidatus Methanoperedens nitroreducens]MDJ1423450.1 translation initiation factor IF-5A [Candidatus Methanoperedens sp.]
MKEQVEVRSLKEGKYVLIDDEPCVIKSITHSKTGKHGSAKARIDAIGIFDGTKRSIVAPVTDKTYVPLVERKSGQVLSVSGDVAQVMDMADYSTLEIKIPDEFKGKIEAGKEISYLISMGKMKIDMRI